MGRRLKKYLLVGALTLELFGCEKNREAVRNVMKCNEETTDWTPKSDAGLSGPLGELWGTSVKCKENYDSK